MRRDGREAMRAAWVATAAALLMATAGCISWRTPVQPPRGLLVTTYRAPLTPELDDARVSGKLGTATAWYIREPFITGRGVSWGAAGLEEAARQGGLSEVRYADYEILEVLTVFGRFTVRAHGE